MKRTTLIACIAGGVVLILLWYFLLFSPTSKDLNDTRGQVSTAQSQKEELQNTIRRLKELSRNAAKQAATLRTLRAAIPANPDLGAFILQANDIATETGIDWLSISPSPPTTTGGGGPNSTIAVSMQVDGGFFQVLDYLNRLEDLDRLLIVDTINVSAGSADPGATGSSGDTGGSAGGAPDLSVTLTGRMFTGAAAPAAPGSSSSGGSTLTPSTPGGTTATTAPGGSTSGSTPGSTTPPASSSGTSS